MKQLKVLVFSASFGNGHLRAAEAVIEGIRIKEPTAEIIHLDFGDFLNKAVNTMIKNVYGEIINHIPKLWGRFYYRTSMVKPQSVGQRFLNKLGRKEFINYVNVLKPDLIICTYPTVSSVLAQLRQEKILGVPVITIVTDYTLHSHWVHPSVDRYIVACPEVRESLLSWGIENWRIHDSGIPVSPKFEETIDRNKVLSQLGLKPDQPILLVMGGSYGVLKSANRICKNLAESIIPVQTIIVCGKNEKLYHSLKEVITQTKNPLVRLKYVHNVEELMSVSNLIITKAGGLTVSEALTKHLPLLIYKPIPGQEEENAHFIQKIGAGVVAETEAELNRLINYLLRCPEEVDKMREKATAALPGHSTQRAVEEILELVNNRDYSLNMMGVKGS
ncbi:UDP-N-acetylglucosamine:LPS N-acetylglucosamine transferase [Desulfosporosinus orientis DSM 765]|uniref:UDP-N-acetylglucosamine:LPS N-acetylglucosamine transferase n=1 Tax=Desulfosporosinus orientis (strain ATCC 19365 / DSM 765 / NCIMB 8382 / VKM B-1628 / Singapore I) TaxID=768706 RepID=G7WHL3_DESOD|nr:glycosyltransferase [Desulfosporosinus orientis]AET70934.1 UDP-N-acetylglucosamine:LPS N-acetylglucosamine transferase [Desulfosporosinus orientis DSM 765]